MPQRQRDWSNRFFLQWHCSPFYFKTQQHCLMRDITFIYYFKFIWLSNDVTATFRTVYNCKFTLMICWFSGGQSLNDRAIFLIQCIARARSLRDKLLNGYPQVCFLPLVNSGKCFHRNALGIDFDQVARQITELVGCFIFSTWSSLARSRDRQVMRGSPLPSLPLPLPPPPTMGL